MLAIELVEVAIIGRVMFGTIPPVPVAAFRNEQFLISQLALRFRALESILFVGSSSLKEVVPRTVVLRGADPDVEVGGDPGTGGDRVQAVDVVMASNRFRNGDGLHPRSVLQFSECFG